MGKMGANEADQQVLICRRRTPRETSLHNLLGGLLTKYPPVCTENFQLYASLDLRLRRLRWTNAIHTLITRIAIVAIVVCLVPAPNDSQNAKKQKIQARLLQEADARRKAEFVKLPASNSANKASRSKTVLGAHWVTVV